jgi:hypothetical protein
MSIQDWGAVGEIIGAIAVVVTLLYLATQIRHNTRSLRNAASSSVNAALQQMLARRAENPNGFTDIWVRGCADLDSLKPVERDRWECHALDILNLAVYVHQLERDDLADVHIDYIEYMRMLIHANPGLKAFMRNIERGWSASRKLFDRMMEEPKVKLQNGPGLVNEPEPSDSPRSDPA